MKNKIYKIQGTRSNINWIGRKVTGAHHGSIAIKEGFFIVEDEQLIGGKIIIDMASIKVLDITDPNTNAQFAGHLASCDFFDLEHYPEAVFEIDAVSGVKVYGRLTIKDITKALNCNAQIRCGVDTLTASGKIIVDRTDYGMKFRSGSFFKDLGDKLIDNLFELNVSLTGETES